MHMLGNIRYASAVLLAVQLACGDGQNEPEDSEETGFPGTSSGSGTTSGSTTGTTSGTSTGTTSTGTTSGTTGTTTDTTDTTDTCVDAEGCWNCDPVEPIHFLNRCTDATCEPFDNTQTRLPLIGADGSLPPLP